MSHGDPLDFKISIRSRAFENISVMPRVKLTNAFPTLAQTMGILKDIQVTITSMHCGLSETDCLSKAS